VPVVELDLFAPDAIARVRESGVRAVLFDLPWLNGQSIQSARHLVRAFELMGLQVFPNTSVYWHYEDKLAQHCLFESLQIPSCPTWVFYSAREALAWAKDATYPKVWKLKTGASSSNVRLVRSPAQAGALISRAFGRGFSPVPRLLDDFNTKLYKHNKDKDWPQALRRLPHTVRNILTQRKAVPSERGYAFFQDFLPGNAHDTRVTVIGQRAFAFRRFTRPDDFRASGSGRIDWEPAPIDLDCVRLAFTAAAKIGSRCLAFDIIHDSERKPVVLEVSYRFIAEAVERCPGYWDERMTFHEGHIWPQDAILDDLLERLPPFTAGLK
jgi:glutathione synthase/RimK-type ligase-like ATP-grasp enzyme